MFQDSEPLRFLRTIHPNNSFAVSLEPSSRERRSQISTQKFRETPGANNAQKSRFAHAKEVALLSSKLVVERAARTSKGSKGGMKEGGV